MVQLRVLTSSHTAGCLWIVSACVLFTALVVREAKKRVPVAVPTTSTPSTSTSNFLQSLNKQAAEFKGSHQGSAKKLKLFDFMSEHAPSNTERQIPEQVDVAADYQRFLNATTVGMNTFCDPVYARSLRPIALQLFCAPCSSAASERVFSQAGLIMRPHRSRLSKSMLAQLVFLKCNNNLIWNGRQLAKVHFNQTVDSDCWKFKTFVYISD